MAGILVTTGLIVLAGIFGMVIGVNFGRMIGLRQAIDLTDSIKCEECRACTRDVLEAAAK